MQHSPPRLRIPAVSAAQLAAGAERAIVDLRSPKEFAVDHAPGAVNVPLFDDVERELIGTLYARRSPQSAFEVGAERTVAKIGDLTRSIARLCDWDIPDVDLEERVRKMTSGGIGRLEDELAVQPAEALPEGAVVLYCWRGGLRSRSVAAFLDSLGLESVVVVQRGYKGYRSWVLESLAEARLPASFVLRGLTGVGKTLVLREIEALRPAWTLDLEGLAGHRSSILGMVGLEPCSQKAFDTRLLHRLSEGLPGPCVMEGESRKVGDVILPARVWEALGAGTNITLTAPLERRVRVLMEDYLAEAGSREELATKLPFLETRLGKGWEGELVALLEARREAELVEVLLERYYDPLYRHSENRRDSALELDATDPALAAQTIVRWIEERPDSDG